MSVSETATFRGDDPDCLVDAGLACRWCLSARVEWELELDPWEDRATGRCCRCARRETVALTRDQALRLSLRAVAVRAPAAPVAPLAGLRRWSERRGRQRPERDTCSMR